MSWLTDHCPRLAKAVADHNRHVEHARAVEHNRREALANMERVLAHRELQLIRAYRTNDARYIKRRFDKLERAKQAVERLRAA